VENDCNPLLDFHQLKIENTENEKVHIILILTIDRELDNGLNNMGTLLEKKQR
jgi:hypothetical protein